MFAVSSYENNCVHVDQLGGPNRAMQPRCAMRFESHTPKSLAMRKSFFFFFLRCEATF